MLCPNCGKQVPEAAECAACGIVVAKYLARQQARARQAAARPREAPETATQTPGRPLAAGNPNVRRPWPLRPVSDRRLAGFYHQLAGLLESGLALDGALELFERNLSGALGRACKEVRRRLGQGAGLAEALREQVRVFGTEALYLVEAGERSGSLPAVFRALADSCELRVGLRRRLQRSLLFPFILFSLSFFLLPLARLVTAGLGAYLADSLLPYLLVLGAGLAAWLLVPWLGGRLLGPALAERLLDRLPVAGRLRRLRRRARFCRQLAGGLRAGLEMGLALELAGRVSGSLAVRGRVEQVRRQLAAGATLSEAFVRAGLFEREVWLAVEAGERAGRLDETLERQAHADQESFLARLDVAVQLLAVVVLLAVYAFVAWRVIDQYRSIFSGYQGQLDGLLKEAGGGGQGLESLLRGSGLEGTGVTPSELREILK